MTNLETLLQKVEAGELNGGAPHCDLPIIDLTHAYQGSLDAAQRLHEAVLPDHNWAFHHMNTCTIFRADNCNEFTAAYCLDNPARAWLIAIIKALIAEEA